MCFSRVCCMSAARLASSNEKPGSDTEVRLPVARASIALRWLLETLRIETLEKSKSLIGTSSRLNRRQRVHTRSAIIRSGRHGKNDSINRSPISLSCSAPPGGSGRLAFLAARNGFARFVRLLDAGALPTPAATLSIVEDAGGAPARRRGARRGGITGLDQKNECLEMPPSIWWHCEQKPLFTSTPTDWHKMRFVQHMMSQTAKYAGRESW
jgi:hypothetical protein